MAAKKSEDSKSYLEKIDSDLQSNQSRLSLILGALIVLVVGVLIFEFNTVLNALSVRVLVAAGLMINESDEEEKQPLVINQEQQQQEQQQEHVL